MLVAACSSQLQPQPTFDQTCTSPTALARGQKSWPDDAGACLYLPLDASVQEQNGIVQLYCPLESTAWQRVIGVPEQCVCAPYPAANLPGFGRWECRD